MRWLTTALIMGFLAACNGDGDDKSSIDADGDGYDELVDCNDSDATVYPDADELCDTLDNDCDGEVDEEAVDALSFFADTDGDNYGDPNVSLIACEAPEAYVDDNTDCDDTLAEVNPGATEVCDELDVDEDCSGTADDEDAGVDTSTQTDWFIDTDEDNYGDLNATAVAACDDPSDADTFYREDNTDCNDSDDTVNPGATEICDDLDVDEDCSGTADDADTGVDTSTQTLFFVDYDGDTYGDAADVGTLYCDDPSDETLVYSTDNTDCDDVVGDVNPAADEVCDKAGIDENCNGSADDDDATTLAATKTKYYPDADMDAYGAVGRATLYCNDPSTATDMWSLDNTDCDDSTAAVNPAQTEVCDDKNIDEDCNGDADDADSGVDASTKTTYYIDADGDKFGNSSSAGTSVCDDPSTASTAYVTDNTDCDDRAPTTYPGATEITGDAVDSDCDGGEICFVDNDGDNYRTTKTVVSTDADCDDSGEAAASVASGDCDDIDSTINPGATEGIADGIDSDCDGGEICYVNADGDAYRTDATVVSSDDDCLDSGEAFASITSGDCNDSDAKINPGATEVIGDSIDQNCDGKEVCYVDSDNDGYRTSATVPSADSDCRDTGEAGASEPTGDCNDSNADVNPGKTEVCDGLDNDCNASTSEDGTATVTTSGGTTHYTKATITSLFGSASAPYAGALAGDWEFCKGTYYANFKTTTSGALSIQGVTSNASDVTFNGGGKKSVIEQVGGSLTMKNLTVTNGKGSGDWYATGTTYRGSGGGINCYGSSTTNANITLDNVEITGNTLPVTNFPFGGAIAATYCDVSLTDVSITSNSAIYASAIAMVDGDLDMDGVTIEAQTGSYYTIYHGPRSFDMNNTWNDVEIVDNTLRLDGNHVFTVQQGTFINRITGKDVVVSDNTRTITSTGFNAAWYNEAEVTLTSTTAGDSAVTGNDLYGLMVNANGVFKISGGDFGNTATTNNESGDIYARNGSKYNAGTNATFICDANYCGNNADKNDDPSDDAFECVVGGTYNSIENGGTYSYGNPFTADRNSTLESFEVYVSSARGTCVNDYYLLERVSSTSYKVLWRNLNQSVTGVGYDNSGDIGIPVESGKTYATYAITTCPSTNSRFHTVTCSSTVAKNAGLGVSKGYLSTSSKAEIAVGSNLTGLYEDTSSTCVFRQRLILNDLDTTSNATCIP